MDALGKLEGQAQCCEWRMQLLYAADCKLLVTSLTKSSGEAISGQYGEIQGLVLMESSGGLLSHSSGPYLITGPFAALRCYPAEPASILNRQQ